MTCVTGGGYANADEGVSGSLHINSNLVDWNRPMPEEVHLQNEIMETISDIIVEAFGRTPWFKKAMENYSNIPDECMIPGRRIPATCIWLTRDPEGGKFHVDYNIIAPIFAIYPWTVEEGGDLVVLQDNGEPQHIPTVGGTVVGGRFAHYPHGNRCIDEKVPRHSYIVYFDRRCACSSYVNESYKARALLEEERPCLI